MPITHVGRGVESRLTDRPVQNVVYDSTAGQSRRQARSRLGDTPARAQRLYVVCLSSQPWSVDLPTNRQQIVARVAQVTGIAVLYVETGQFVGRHVA